MIRRPPRSTRTDTLFPYTTLCRSHVLKLGLADRDIVRVGIGDRADVRFDAYPRRHFDATVIQIGHGADPRSGTFPVELEIANDHATSARSDESRVGKECVSTCCYSGTPSNYKTNQQPTYTNTKQT